MKTGNMLILNTAPLNYSAGITDLSLNDRVCKSIDSVKIKTAFKTLRQVVTRVKNKIPQEKTKV